MSLSVTSGEGVSQPRGVDGVDPCSQPPSAQQIWRCVTSGGAFGLRLFAMASANRLFKRCKLVGRVGLVVTRPILPG